MGDRHNKDYNVYNAKIVRKISVGIIIDIQTACADNPSVVITDINTSGLDDASVVVIINGNVLYLDHRSIIIILYKSFVIIT